MVVTDKGGKKVTLTADTIIPALPLKPDDDIFERLKSKISEVCQIGDCGEPGYISDAIADGSRIGRII